MIKRMVLVVSVMLLIVPVLLAAGCQNESRDPFTSTMSLDEENRSISISGSSAGHAPGKQSKFQLVISNRSGEAPWQGELLVLLIDQKGIVAEIANKQFYLPVRHETQSEINADFPKNYRGPIGLGVVVPEYSSMVTTLWVGEVGPAVAPWPNPASLTEPGSRVLAEKFVRNSPTFAFDGIEESLVLKETLRLLKEHEPGSPETLSKVHGWSFTFIFESRHAGYGDRSGQVLSQVITPHEAVVMVEAGEVTSAVMDGVWDMINQKMLNIQQRLDQLLDFQDLTGKMSAIRMTFPNIPIRG